VEAPGNISTITATKIRPIDERQLDILEPWIQIGDLQNIPGVGIYRTEFDWPQNSRQYIAVYARFSTP
jgi:hypothetical protein